MAQGTVKRLGFLIGGILLLGIPSFAMAQDQAAPDEEGVEDAQ